MEFVLNDKQSVYDSVSEEISRFGISPVKLGYTYLVEAVTYVLEDEDSIHGITKSIYPRLAQTFLTTPEAVERAMRTAISRACKSFGEGRRKAVHFTNKEFIFKIVRTVKKQLDTVNIDKY